TASRRPSKKPTELGLRIATAWPEPWASFDLRASAADSGRVRSRFSRGPENTAVYRGLSPCVRSMLMALRHPNRPPAPLFPPPWSRKLVVLVLTAMAPALAFAAPQVRGKLVGLEKLMNPAWAEAKESSSHRFSWREPSPTVRAEFRNLFGYAPKEVCVAALASSPQQPPALPLLITVGGGRTTPVT